MVIILFLSFLQTKHSQLPQLFFIGFDLTNLCNTGYIPLDTFQLVDMLFKIGCPEWDTVFKVRFDKNRIEQLSWPLDTIFLLMQPIIAFRFFSYFALYVSEEVHCNLQIITLKYICVNINTIFLLGFC